MKKYVPFIIGLLFAIPISASAYVFYPVFPDVDSDAWYAGAIEQAWRAGWMTGYKDENFGPQNPVLRGEMAKILSNYDQEVKKMHSNLQDILCLNKNNSLQSLGLQITDEEKYSNALESFCTDEWNKCGNFQYDPETGEYDTDDLIIC